jgi:predicted deacylase
MQNNFYLEINTKKPGPCVAIFAGIHGNEICGIEAFKTIIPTLNIDCGSVIFAYGNPRAIEQNLRFTEYNLNRAFKDDSCFSDDEKNTYEYKRAQKLKNILTDVDILLDIHSSFTPGSEPFIICEKNALPIVSRFSKSFVRIAHGFDTVESGGTDGYMNSVGKIGICIECGYHYAPGAVSIAEKTIVDFLTITGNITGRNIPDKMQRPIVQVETMYTTQTDLFEPVKEFDDFEPVTQEQIIGFDTGTPVYAPKNGFVVFARKREKIGSEGFVFGVM